MAVLSLSQTSGYAILALACLDGPGGTPMRVEDIARCRHISKTYLSKIVHSLAEKGLVKTKRGKKGGLLLARSPEQVSLYDVAEAIEGPGCIGDCLLGIESCLDLCPTHPFWKEETNRIENELRSRNLTEIKKANQCDPEPNPDLLAQTSPALGGTL